MAAHSNRATLGLMVGGVHYRQAGLWAKAATTLDVLSDGRAYLGIGAAWNEEESHGLGFPMPPLGVRFEMLEETLQIVHADVEGRTRLRGCLRRAALPGRAAAQLAAGRSPGRTPGSSSAAAASRRRSGWWPSTPTPATSSAGPDVLTHKFDVLRQHCAEVGRPFEEIERTSLQSVDFGRETPAQVVDRFRVLADVGVQHVIFNMAERLGSAPLRHAGARGHSGGAGHRTEGDLTDGVILPRSIRTC